MKNFLSIFLILTSLFSFGQTDTLEILGAIELEKAKHDFFVVIYDREIKLDSISLTQIDEKWIKEITVVKDEKYANIIGNTPIKAILLYPKNRFKKRILRLLD